MLARTQALEARVTELTAEKNELAAEYARMPTHTAGKTLQASQWWWVQLGCWTQERAGTWGQRGHSS